MLGTSRWWRHVSHKPARGRDMPSKYGSGHIPGTRDQRDFHSLVSPLEGAAMRGPRLTDRQLRQAIVVLGLTQLAIGVWLLADPDSFT